MEGFANWVSMTTIGAIVSTSPFGGDHGLENNVYLGSPTNPPSGGDGVRVEAAVAAFLYDLIDTGSELDGLTNGVGTNETHDSLSVSPGWVLDVIEHCTLRVSSSTTVIKLSGADELVYCVENSVAAQAVASPLLAPSAWRTYLSVGFGQTLPTYNQALIRKLWKFNFYGV